MDNSDSPDNADSKYHSITSKSKSADALKSLHEDASDNNNVSGNVNISKDTEYTLNNVGAEKAKPDKSLKAANGDSSLNSAFSNGEKSVKKTTVEKNVKKNDSGSKKNGGNDKKNDKNYQAKKKRYMWLVKITLISLVLSAVISFVGDLTASSEHLIVTLLLLLFLILASILFDGIGVAVTSCDDTAFTSMSSRKIYGAKTALWLVKNSEKVSSICNDVIGDIFGIISGACAAAIVTKIIIITGDSWQRWLTIGISAVVSALTIGGKAFLKNIAISNSKEFVMFVARIIGIFDSEERRRKKKQTAQKKADETALLQASEKTDKADKTDVRQANAKQNDVKKSLLNRDDDKTKTNKRK